jgi:hypothetical protein
MLEPLNLRSEAFVLAPLLLKVKLTLCFVYRPVTHLATLLTVIDSLTGALVKVLCHSYHITFRVPTCHVVEKNSGVNAKAFTSMMKNIQA